MKNIFLTILIFFMISSFSFADFDLTSTTVTKTTQAYAKGIQLGWTANIESDMSSYAVYMSINSLDSFTSTGIIMHPTVTWKSEKLIRGNIYYWCLTAIDLAGNESVPSKIAATVIINSKPKFKNSIIYL